MKTNRTIAGWLALAALAVFNLQPSTALAVTFTVTPAAVSNTYNGTITLSVSNVATGDRVVIQKFIDANTNGVIDGGDWLAQQFALTDGQPGMVIGGVTNFNVPGDLNSATGAITATLNFENGDKVGNFVGKYLFKLSSPAGHFAPITNAFTVTNYPFAQKITGSVVNSGTNVPNAVVVVMSWPQGVAQAGTVANNSGGYTMAMPPGAYMLVAVKSNYVANFEAATVVNLGSSQTVTTNLTMTNATASISGKVVDASNSSIVLPGLTVMAESANGLFAVGFTDTNGNFTAKVRSGQWNVRPQDTSLIVHGYLGLEDGTNVNAGTTGITIAVPQAAALVFGSVKDNLGNPMMGIDLWAHDSDYQTYQTEGYTGANGKYVLGTLAGDWDVGVSTDNSPTNYIFGGGQGVTLTNGQALQLNFTALLATNQITGSLKDNNNNPISGVWIWANANINGTYYQAGVDTDGTGHYSINVANGTWDVGVNSGGGGDSLPGNYLCPASQSVVISNNNGTANFTAIAGATNQITGHVQQANGTPIPGLGVEAGATINGVMYYVAAGTDGNGNYSLNVVNTNWGVWLFCNGCPCGNLYSLDNILGPGNYQCPALQNVTISNNNGTANFIVQLCNGVQILTTSLPDGQVGFYYDQFLQGSTCSGTLNWSLNDPQDFPSSLGWSGNGEIQGTPNSSGTYNFSVHLDDGDGHTADQSLSLYIAPASTPLQITTTSLPNGTNGVFYSQQLQSSGGQPPCHWSLSPGSASLPPNLTLATNGVLSGVPLTNGTFNFFVRVTDSVNANVDRFLSLTIANLPLLITTTNLPSATQNAFYSTTLSATGGQPPYTWVLGLGSAALPLGLSLTTNGVISGTPNSSGTEQFIAVVFDATGAWVYEILSLTINASSIPPVIILTAPAQLANRQFQFNFTTASGVSYTIQYATDLKTWTPLLTFSGSGGPETIMVPIAAGQRFYRVKVGP